MEEKSPLPKRSLERKKREELNTAYDRLREAVIFFGQHRSALGSQILVIKHALSIITTHYSLLQQIIVPEENEVSKKKPKSSPTKNDPGFGLPPESALTVKTNVLFLLFYNFK